MKRWLVVLAAMTAHAQGSPVAQPSAVQSLVAPAYLGATTVNTKVGGNMQLGITLQIADACTTIQGIDILETDGRLIIAPQLKVFHKDCAQVDGVLKLFKAIDAAQASRFSQALVRFGSEERLISLTSGEIAKDPMSPPQHLLR